jgi:hypothetical protein
MKFNIRTAEVNLCETNDSTCKDNLNLSRIEMPVIEEDFLNLLEDGMLDIQEVPNKAKGPYINSGKGLEKNKVQVEYTNIDVNLLKPIQKEIWLSKAIKIAFSEKDIKEPIIVSKDLYIIDGHHRWAAILLLSHFNETDLVKILTLAVKDKIEDIQDIFLTKRTKKKNMPCMKVDLNGKKLLKIANAYTDAKGIKRKE